MAFLSGLSPQAEESNFIIHAPFSRESYFRARQIRANVWGSNFLASVD